MSFFAILAFKCLCAGLASAGFGILFSVRRRALPICLGCGAFAYALRSICVEMQWLPLEAATFVGALGVGFLSEILARCMKMPATVFKVPAVLPLLPGRLAFEATIGLIQIGGFSTEIDFADVHHILRMSVLTVLIMVGLVAGLTFPGLLFYRRPVPQG